MLTVPDNYAWVLLSVLAMGFQMVLQGYSIVSLRKKIFSEQFFKAMFPGADYKEYYLNGYPDMGSGRFSEKLSFEEWLRFNSHQRSHYHYVENIAFIVLLTLISGLFCVPFTVACAAFYLLGRFLYSMGYRTAGPNGRQPGAYIMVIVQMLLLGNAVYHLWGAGGGLSGLMNLFPPVLVEAVAPYPTA